MATFARSFISTSTYLNPHRRPGMPERTLSSSSDLSITSNTSAMSDDLTDMASSRPTTPSHPPTSVEETAPAVKAIGTPDVSSKAIHRMPLTRPIAIELPKIKKMNSAPIYTPPEPLSARGDLPGGYFPLHEDPTTRVRRPHPFHHRSSESSSLASDAKRSQTIAGSFVSHGSHMPAVPASYCTSNHHGNPMPLGKYYPSNYEKRFKEQLKKSKTSSPSLAAIAAAALSPVPMITQGEARRKMETYQREMAARAQKSLGKTAEQGKMEQMEVLQREDQPDMDLKYQKTTGNTTDQREIEAFQRDHQREMVTQFSRALENSTDQRKMEALQSDYQREMDLQKQMTMGNYTEPYCSSPKVVTKPVSPRLRPKASPGPVTPMLLSDELVKRAGNLSLKPDDRETDVVSPLSI